MISSTYFSDTTPTNDQNVSDSTPSTLAGVGRTPCAPKASCRAYSGLVAMSPKTTPSAASAIAGNAACWMAWLSPLVVGACMGARPIAKT